MRFGTISVHARNTCDRAGQPNPCRFRSFYFPHITVLTIVPQVHLHFLIVCHGYFHYSPYLSALEPSVRICWHIFAFNFLLRVYLFFHAYFMLRDLVMSLCWCQACGDEISYWGLGVFAYDHAIAKLLRGPALQNLSIEKVEKGKSQERVFCA